MGKIITGNGIIYSLIFGNNAWQLLLNKNMPQKEVAKVVGATREERAGG
ncbi:MAG: hypothetical protein JRN32_01370 [Nitrososphaerota archaeon]|jgi:hypothetical protein|nr:hypothetical protein [Nitrososphaerota archaeon]MDG7040732.1 hypothetical protein [Nitrososphaerota archaeon]MDG7045450.1 hypothetical protein [Nitrososphaerota archaeon]